MPEGFSSPIENRKIEKRPSLQELYAMYGYQPPKLPLLKKFEWLPGQEEQIRQAIIKVLDFNNLDDSRFEHVSFENKTVFEVRYSKADGAIESKLFDPQGILVASFDLINKTEGRLADFHEDGQKWVLTHRIISEEYRGQEMGSKILKILENGIQYVADRTQLTQTVVIDARQLGIINFALKNGYQPMSAQDEENLKMVYSGDRSKILVATDPRVSSLDRERYGYMYSIAGKKMALTINFKKDILPSEKAA